LSPKDPMVKKTIYAMTGEVKAGGKDSIIKSGALGSCIAIVAFNKTSHTAVMAHIMLPGEAPENMQELETRYSSNGIKKMIELSGLSRNNDIEVCIAGGANVLKRKKDDIWQQIINSVEGILRLRKVKVAASSLGGVLRRSVAIDVETGCVYYTLGDDPKKLLWKFEI